MRDRKSDTAHRQAAERKLGRKLKPGEIVDHLDHDKSNQSGHNLAVTTRSAHTTKHNDPVQKKLGKLRKALDIMQRKGPKLF